jgi:hypothetical protein
MAIRTRGKEPVENSMDNEWWQEGLEPVTIGVTPDAKAKLNKMARQTGMSVSHVGSIIFEAQMDKHTRLEESLRRMISKHFDEEYIRIEKKLKAIVSPIEKVNQFIFDLLPFLGRKTKGRVSN